VKDFFIYGVVGYCVGTEGKSTSLYAFEGLKFPLASRKCLRNEEKGEKKRKTSNKKGRENGKNKTGKRRGGGNRERFISTRSAKSLPSVGLMAHR
jgi:hypothetical protein